MQFNTDDAFKNAFNEATKHLNKEQAGKMVFWFFLGAIFINVIWYGLGSWITLLAINALFGPIIEIGIEQLLGVAWFMYLTRHLLKVGEK